MIWIVLRAFLAWGSARIIKKQILKTDFGKPIAIILAIIWGTVWGIAAAFAFEYIFGVGTFKGTSLVPSILFTSIASYYALIAKDFTGSPIKNSQTSIEPNRESVQEQPAVEIKPASDKWLRKLMLVKSGLRTALSLTVAFVLFAIIMIVETISINTEWSMANQKFKAGSNQDKVVLCHKLLSNDAISEAYYDSLARLNPPKNAISNEINELKEQIVNCENIDTTPSNSNGKYNQIIDIVLCEEQNNKLAFSMNCLAAESPPGSLIGNTWNSLQKSHFAIPLCLFVGLLVFTSLLTGRVLLLEKKLGWKRLSIVSGFTFAFIALIIILAVADSFRSDELIAIWILIALMLIPLTTIILVLKGRSLFEWVKEGFREH